MRAKSPETASRATAPARLTLEEQTDKCLAGNCGLAKMPLDESGRPVSAELLESLDADEADDIVAGYTLKTTEAGRAVAALLDPAKRLAATLAHNRGRIDTFAAILRFCSKQRLSR